MKLPEDICAFLMRRARQAGSREVCGFILSDKTGWSVLQITNVSGSDTGFHMDDGELLKAYQEHRDAMVGMYHSHPSGDPHPSFDDLQYAPERLRYWIVTSEEVVEWNVGTYGDVTETSLAGADPGHLEANRQGDQEATGADG